jgi:hypothetical protein
VVRALKADSSLFRVVGLGPYGEENYFVVHEIRNALGYNGQELHRYDVLLGEKGAPRNILSPSIWPVIGAKYVALDQAIPDQMLTELGVEPVGGTTPMRAFWGQPGYLYRIRNAAPFAYMVANGFRVDATDEQIAATLASPQFDARRLVLLPKDSPVGADSTGFGEPITTPVAIREDRPGKFHAELTAPLAQDAFLYIAENWYPDWHATLDGKPAQLLRAQLSGMAVHVPAGGRVVELEFIPRKYQTGRFVTLASLILVVARFVSGLLQRRRATVPAGEPTAAPA